MNLKKIFFFFTILVYAYTVKAQTAEQIISKYIEFTGGSQWKEIKTIVTTGKYSYGGMEFSFTSYSKAPNLYKYEVMLNGKKYIQSYDGMNGWKIDGFNNDTTPTFLSGKSAVAMANEADVELESPLMDYKRKGNKVILQGIDTVQTIACFKINFIRKDGETETYFFNSTNYELLLKKAVSKNVELKNAIIDTFYSDYRLTRGVKIPFKSFSKINGQTILTVTIENVQVNVPVPDKTFQP